LKTTFHKNFQTIGFIQVFSITTPIHSVQGSGEGKIALQYVVVKPHWVMYFAE